MTPSCLAAGTRTALASPLFLRSALVAVAVSVAFASSMATAAPLPEQSGILTDDQFVQELHQLCLRIPDSDNPLSDAAIVNGVQRLFPQLTSELKNPTNLVSVDLFLSNGGAWPSNIVSRLWKPKPQLASADPNSKRRVQFVRDLIAADRGDGRKLAFAAVLTALMPSQDLGAVLADPDTLLVLLLQRTRAISPSWPLIGLWRRIVDSMTPTSLIQLKDAALHLVFEIYLKPMFQSILLRELSSSQADAIRIFHRISLSATPPKVEAFAKTVISQWPAHPILWSHVFGAYLHQQLAPKIQYRSIIEGLLRRSATAYGPGVNADDLLIQLVLHSGPSMADLATMLLPLTKVPGRSVGSSTNYVCAKDFSSFLHQEFFDNICGSSSLQYRAMQHCALSGLVEPLAIAMRPCLLDISGQTLYFLIRGAPGIVDHWSDLHGVLGKLMGVSVYRLIDGRQRLGYPAGCKQPSSIMQDKFKLAAHMLTVAQTQANYDRSFSEALVQLLFLHTLDHASSVDVIRSPLWLPTAANMARLNTALVQQPIPVSHAAESIRALMAHPDMLALLKAESATHLRLDLMRVLQRLYNEAPLSDWIEIVQNPQWTPSIINLNLLRLEVVAGTVTGSVCSELIQALLHRFGYTQKKTIKRNAASVGLRDLLMELYLRSPSTEYITLIRDLPLTDTDWSTIINKELWHPSAHHLAAMNTLLSMDSKPDQAFTNMIWTLLNRPDIPDVLNGNDGAELRRLLSALMERSLGLDFVQLLKHKNWPSSLWQNVVKDQRWTLTMDNLTALREQVSKDSGPLSVCGDIIRELLARHDVKVMLNVWEQSEPLQYLLIWLFHRMVISHPDLIKSAAVSVWSPDRCWIMLVEDSRWSPSSANIGVLEAALAAHSVSYSDHLIRILFERTDVKALIATNTDESQQLRNVLLALHQTASFPDWASLFALPYWSASVWPLLLGKPDWMPTNNNLDALRKSIPADSVTDAAWIEVLDALLKHREVCCRLQEKGSASDESSLQSLLTSLYQHIPETHADSVRAKYPLYSNLFPPRDSTASGSVKGESVSGSGAHSTSG